MIKTYHSLEKSQNASFYLKLLNFLCNWQYQDFPNLEISHIKKDPDYLLNYRFLTNFSQEFQFFLENCQNFVLLFF